MSAPDDPYAPPPRDREAGQQAEHRAAAGPGRGAPAAGWPAPTVPAVPGSAPAPGRTGLGTAAAAVGVVALLLGVTIVGGVVLGALAITLGLHARARATGAGRTAGRTGVAGLVLGVLALLAAGGTWLWLHDDLAEYQGCRRESVSLAQDRACEQQLKDRIAGR